MRLRPMSFSAFTRLCCPISPKLFACALVAMVFGGCSSAPQVKVDWRGGPFFTATNFSGLDVMPAEVRRVAVMPLSGVDALPPESASALVSAMRTALLSEARFELTTVPVELVRLVASRLSLASTDVLPPELFARIRRETGADAVLFVDITQYRPYAPLALGVRLKLTYCSESPAIFWAFDTLYDAREPAVANSARNHATGGRSAIIDSGASALQSPSRFAAYVFADAFSTLPKRPAPAPAKVSPPSTD